MKTNRKSKVARPRPKPPAPKPKDPNELLKELV